MGKRRDARNTKEEVEIIISENKEELTKAINKLAGRYGVALVDDVKQVGWTVCASKARHYNKNKHKPFTQYIYCKLASAMAKYAGRERKYDGVRRDDFLAPSDEQKKLIRDIVASKLDEDMLKIITLKFFDRASIKEIALNTEMAISQVNYRLKEALGILKKEFLKVGITGFDNKDTSVEITK